MMYSVAKLTPSPVNSQGISKCAYLSTVYELQIISEARNTLATIVFLTADILVGVFPKFGCYSNQRSLIFFKSFLTKIKIIFNIQLMCDISFPHKEAHYITFSTLLPSFTGVSLSS